MQWVLKFEETRQVKDKRNGRPKTIYKGQIVFERLCF